MVGMCHYRTKAIQLRSTSYISKRFQVSEHFPQHTYEKHGETNKMCRRKISKALPGRFALSFYGWQCGETHYIGVFAKFPSEEKEGYEKDLLGISPMADDSTQDDTEQQDFLNFVL